MIARVPGSRVYSRLMGFRTREGVAEPTDLCAGTHKAGVKVRFTYERVSSRTTVKALILLPLAR